MHVIKRARAGEEDEGIFLILSLVCAHGRCKGVEEENKGSGRGESGREGVEARFALRHKQFLSWEEREIDQERERNEREGELERREGEEGSGGGGRNIPPPPYTRRRVRAREKQISPCDGIFRHERKRERGRERREREMGRERREKEREREKREREGKRERGRERREREGENDSLSSLLFLFIIYLLSLYIKKYFQ